MQSFVVCLKFEDPGFKALKLLFPLLIILLHKIDILDIVTLRLILFSGEDIHINIHRRFEHLHFLIDLFIQWDILF